MVTILMMSAKMATLGLLNIKVFEIKIIGTWFFVHDFTNRVSSSDPEYIVDVVMRKTFGKSSISMREVTIILMF